MGIRTILTVLDGGPRGELAIAAAIAMGNAVSAHVEILHVEPMIETALPVIGESAGAVAAVRIMQTAEEDIRRRAECAEALFHKHCIEPGLQIIDADSVPPKDQASFSWRLVSGHDNPEIARRGRFSDLIVMARANEIDGGADSALLEAALFDSGRPVFVAGDSPVNVDGERIIVAWDGSREAAHSLGLAIPLLTRAGSVHVLSIGDDETVVDPDPLVRYLSSHGITAEAETIERQGRKIAKVLLEEAGSRNAGLLIMGAYGHSAFSEYLFGGVTRTVLEQATIPVFMAH